MTHYRSMHPSGLIEREQRLALMGMSNYEGLSTVLRAYSPYQGRNGHVGLGDTEQPYDLNAPGVVREIKTALIELARRGADPLRNPSDPIVETTWKRLADEMSDPQAVDAWTGAAADEYLTMLSRYQDMRSGLDGPFMQLGGSKFGKYGMVGGAQPTAHGLEVLAGAVKRDLGQDLMPLYLSWRSGTFAPPSSVSSPPANAVVRPVTTHGPFWNPFGYTPAYDQGDAELKKAVDDADEGLVKCMQTQTMLTTEAQRVAALNDCLGAVRRGRHYLVLKLNAMAPTPDCGQGMVYRRDLARCVPSTDLEPPTVEDCIQAYMELEGKTREQAAAICRGEDPPQDEPTSASSSGATTVKALLAGGAIGMAIWYATRPKTKAMMRRRLGRK